MTKDNLENSPLEVAALKQVVKELTGKVQLLVDWVDEKGLLEDHVFTFPDGDVYVADGVTRCPVCNFVLTAGDRTVQACPNGHPLPRALWAQG